MPTVGVLYFGLTLPLLFFPLYLPPPIFKFSIHILISSVFTDFMFYDVTDALPFSFPFPLLPSSTE
jgi:hypothetical protein